MTTRYEDQTVIYDDADKMPAPHDTDPLDTTPTTHSILDLDSKTAAGYSEDNNPQSALVQLQEYFQQLQERFNHIGPTANPPIHAEELAHLSEKL